MRRGCAGGSAQVNTFGGVSNAGNHDISGEYFVEPMATLAYLATSADMPNQLAPLGGYIHFDNRSDFRGGRVGMEMANSSMSMTSGCQ